MPRAASTRPSNRPVPAPRATAPPCVTLARLPDRGAADLAPYDTALFGDRRQAVLRTVIPDAPIPLASARRIRAAMPGARPPEC
jgi:hypothetical protein